MILKDKNKNDISYRDLKDLASDMAYAYGLLQNVEMDKRTISLMEKTFKSKKAEIIDLVDRASVRHEGAGKFYPYGYAVLVDSLENDNEEIKKLNQEGGEIFYSKNPYLLSTTYEREVMAWWLLKDIIFDYGIKHGYLQVGPKERLNKDILRGIKDNFCSVPDDRLKIVGRDFSEEELDKYMAENRAMER